METWYGWRGSRACEAQKLVCVVAWRKEKAWHFSRSVSREHGKGKSEVRPAGSRTRPRRSYTLCSRVGSWLGIGEPLKMWVLCPGQIWVEGCVGGKVGASASHIQEDLGCGLSQKEESLENFWGGDDQTEWWGVEELRWAWKQAKSQNTAL